MKARGKVITRIACVGAGIILLSAAIDSSATRPDTDDATLTGTWYVTFDAGVGASIPAVVTLHRDGTLSSSDATDFGGPPFPVRSTPIRGVWTRTRAGTFEAAGIHLSADPMTGEFLHITRTTIFLQFGDDFDQIEGEVFQDVFLCATPFTCPDPLTAEPDATPPSLPFLGRRLRLETQPFHNGDEEDDD